MENKVNYFKRSFAEFQAKYDDESYKTHKKKKNELFKDVKGEVLEIGPGTGVNFPFLKNKGINWHGIEPNPAMYSYLFEAADRNSINAKLLECDSEDICLDSDSMDYVISTEVLCSVNDLEKSLAEIKRVLKPGGKFLFLEHVVDKHNLIRRAVQKTVPHTPWKCFSDGCNPGRDIASAIERAGFSHVDSTDYMQEGKGVIQSINRPHIYGFAVK